MSGRLERHELARARRLDTEHLDARRQNTGRLPGEPLAATAGAYGCPECPERYTTGDGRTQHWVRAHAGSNLPALERPGARRALSRGG